MEDITLLDEETEAFIEVRKEAINIWKSNYSDEHGYVTEKVNRILNCQPSDTWLIIQMFNTSNRAKLLASLSTKVRIYILTHIINKL